MISNTGEDVAPCLVGVGEVSEEVEEALEEAGVGGGQKVRLYLEDQKHLYTADLYILDIEKQ